MRGARHIASAGVAFGLVVATMLATMAADVAVPSGSAFADSGTISYTCATSSGSFLIPINVTGSIPSGLAAGDTFSMSNYQVQVTIPPAVASVLASDGISSLSGTTGALLNATNATPSSVTPSLSWGPVPVVGTGFSFSFPTTPTTIGPFVADSGASPPVLSAGALNTTLHIGAANISSACTPPAPDPVIAAASLSLSTTPSATSIVASSPGGLTDTATVSGIPALGAPTGTVNFYVCGPGASTCSSAGTEVGPAVSLTAGADNTSSATSAVLDTPSVPGNYCFFAQYSGDAHYPVQGDNAGECFVVTPPVPCNPSCTGTVSSTAGTVVVSGSSSTAGNLFLAVGQATLNCGKGFDAAVPFTTLQETGYTSSAPLTVTDTASGVPTLKRFAVCYQSFAGPFKDVHGKSTLVGFLHKCKGTTFTAPCIKSEKVVGGSVVTSLLVPPNDPRFHAGGAAPVVTSVSPASGAPKATVTIKGAFLKGAKVRVGSIAVAAKAAASKITLTLPTLIPPGIVPITITTATGSTVYRNFRVT